MNKLILPFILWLALTLSNSQTADLNSPMLTYNPCHFCPPGTICQNNQCVLDYDYCKFMTCSPGLICVKSVCKQPQTKCSETIKCPDNQVCVNQTCTVNSKPNQTLSEQNTKNPPTPTCDDCVQGEFCFQNQCINQTDSMEYTSPCSTIKCPIGQTCLNGQCARSNAFSDTTSSKPSTGTTTQSTPNLPYGQNVCQPSCTKFQTCKLGSCVSTSLRSQCSPACSANEKCISGLCIANDPCQNINCNENENCENGQCILNSIPTRQITPGTIGSN